jgi:putative ABC transport system permease protein
MFSLLTRELRQSLRGLLRTPAFCATSVITLTLSFGATTAVYSVLESVALRPLPYRGASELVSVLHPTTVPGTGKAKWGLSAGGYFHYRNASRTLADLGGYTTSSTTVTGHDRAEQIQVAEITASIFTTLQARPALGRLIRSTDDRPGQAPVVVLSHEFWRRRFGSDPGVIGSLLHTSGGSYEIIGVAEPGLTLPKPGPFASTSDLASFAVAIWIPLRLDPAGPFYNSHQYSGVGRLKPGTTAEQAQVELAAMIGSFPQLMPQAYTDRFLSTFNFRVAVTPLRDEVLGPALARTLWVLFAGVALVMLIACANVANLFIVRMNAGQREAATRVALGASRSHLAAHYLSEALLVVCTSALAGLLIGSAALPALLTIAPTSIPRLSAVHIHWTTIGLIATIALLTGVIFGLLPLLRDATFSTTMREAGRGVTSSRGQRRLRDALLVGQVALALLLLVAGGLLLRSFSNLRGVKPGLDPRGVLVFEAPLPSNDYRSDQAVAAVQQFLFARIAALPGVQSVGFTTRVPLQDYTSGCTSVIRQGRPYRREEPIPCVSTPYITPGFFEALDISVEGRLPAWSDVDGPARVAIVTRALAERLWPGEEPIGKGLQEGDGPRGVWPRVVGVIPELRAQGLDRRPTEVALFVAPRTSGAYLVRVSRGDPLALIPAIRKILSDLNPAMPLVNPRTMQSVVDRSMARTSFLMTLLAILGCMALLLSAVGIYGVISYMVVLRRSEIGLRMALGARAGQVVALILRHSIALVFTGISIGWLVTLASTRLLSSLLFGVSAFDPTVLASVSVLLILVALLASAAPARQATRRGARAALLA